MKNYRILLVANSLFFGAVGVMMPLLSLYLQELGADLALISIILTSAVVVALAGNFAWGWLADRTGRRKPFYIAGLVGMAVGYLWLSQANSIAMAWPARLLDGLGMAAVYTLGLTLAGDTLDTSSSKGRSIGLFRGLGSLAWAVGAFTGGRIADLFSISAAFVLCSVPDGRRRARRPAARRRQAADQHRRSASTLPAVAAPRLRSLRPGAWAGCRCSIWPA